MKVYNITIAPLLGPSSFCRSTVSKITVSTNNVDLASDALANLGGMSGNVGALAGDGGHLAADVRVFVGVVGSLLGDDGRLLAHLRRLAAQLGACLLDTVPRKLTRRIPQSAPLGHSI